MRKLSKDGWILSTALAYGRGFHFVAPDGHELNGKIITPQECKSEILARMNDLSYEEAFDHEELEHGEQVWRFGQKLANGSIHPVRIRFIAPSIPKIRQIKKDEAETRANIAVIRRERKELAVESKILKPARRIGNERGGASRRL